MSHEYRVVWRREHETRRRSRLYQTLAGAADFARFIEREVTDDYLDDYAFEHLVTLGDTVEVRIEQRTVGEWMPTGKDET